jgi:hypothetical protein
MRVTSAVIQRDLHVSYYKMFLTNTSVCLSSACIANVCARDVVDVLHFVNYPLQRNANDKRCVCRLQIACE